MIITTNSKTMQEANLNTQLRVRAAQYCGA